MAGELDILNEELQKVNEGAWGHGPLDNDSASDWKWKFGDLIIEELKKKFFGHDVSYKYYALGMWEFFKTRLETQYSVFTNDEIEEMDEIASKVAREIIHDTRFDAYDNPQEVRDNIKKFI